MKNACRRAGTLPALGILLFTSGMVLAQTPVRSIAVATTTHFSFHSDFATNLNDALIEAGRARNEGKLELFQIGAEESCFAELPRPTRTAWDLAVDYYAEIVSPAKWSDRQQYLLRLDLSGVEQVKEAGDRRFVGLARSFREAATPAYEACRWPTQDAENRRWIEALIPLLRRHEITVARRLVELYSMPLDGLPIRVDVVETVNWSGANTWLLDPAGGHILISNDAEPGPVSLELVFHEASHVLMGRGAPVRKALADAAEQLHVSLPGDLWHAVLFYTTGDTVRRTLDAAGAPAYTPLLISENIFRRYHEPLERAWPAFLDGSRTLREAALNLIRALVDTEADRPQNPSGGLEK